MFCTKGDSGYRWGGGSSLAFYVDKNYYCFLKAEVPYGAQDSWNWMLILPQHQPILRSVGVGTGAVRGKGTSFHTRSVGLEDGLGCVR